MKRIAALSFALALIATQAAAQVQFKTSSGPLAVGGLSMCLDANGIAVPVSASCPLAVAATITPSGTQDVNLAQILGAAPSLTNPLWVVPATGANFAVTGTFWQATQPVSGTVAATQSGTWTVQPGNTPNTTAWKVDGSAVTQPVSASASATGGATYARVAPGIATTVIKASGGTLFSICLNSAATATNTTTIYDNATGAGTVIGVPAATTATVPTCLAYGPSGIAFTLGLTIITATANGSDMTVSFK